jgi:diadenosine tetraphosphate (Ap4A) HIT family hydrolase
MFSLHPQLEQDCFLVTELGLCKVLLANDRQYPWLILVPRLENVKEIIDLNEQQQGVLWRESAQVSHCLKELFSPDKLNVAALGNMVPQLHIHHVVRYKNDPCWPKPIWGQLPGIPYDEEQLRKRILLLNEKLT